MKALIGILATSIGGGIGWWLGSQIGIGTAIVLSAVGSGVGLYYARKAAAEYLP